MDKTVEIPSHFALQPQKKRIMVKNGGPYEYINLSSSGIPGAFSDPRVFLLRKDDPRAYCFVDTGCHAFQAFDGPTFVVVSENASDASLAMVWERWGIPLADLRDFRDAQLI